MRYSLGFVGLLTAAFMLLGAVCIWAQSPGDTVGWTQYDNQISCPTGQRVAVDNTGGVHLVWMACRAYPSLRNVRYIYIDSTGIAHGHDLDPYGSPQIAVNSQNQPGMACVNIEGVVYWTPAGQYDVAQGGFGPAVSIDREDRIHLVYGSSGFAINYVRSTDGGPNWGIPQVVDSTELPSYMITSSRVSNKTAIVYIRRDISESIWDLMYIETLDGQSWDWENGKMLVVPLADSMYLCGADFDAVYDYNDNLHIIWNNQRENPMDSPDTVYLTHFNAITLQTDLISKWDPWPDSCDLGAWNKVVCKMSIAASANDPLLVVTYTKFNPSDCSLGGYANGEIYMQFSNDSYTWSVPHNLTNSPSPNCPAGYCSSDHWSSIAERIESDLHIFYVYDEDAGAIPQSEGAITSNPMLYYRIPVNLLNVADDENLLPQGSSLAQNYPNPFNAQTTIWYTLIKESNIKIDIFDILGKKLETLKEGRETAGSHAVIWDSGNAPSGIYFSRLQTISGSQVRKMILIK